MKKFFKWVLIVFIAMVVLANFEGQQEEAESDISSGEIKISVTENEVKAIDTLIRDGVGVNFRNKKADTGYIFTTANEIRKAYDDNEVKADKTYKGKNIVISGVVNSINSTLGDIPRVNLRSEQSFYDVYLRFEKKHRDLAVDLKKGQKVQFACIGDGEVMGSPTLDECKPIESAINETVESRKKPINAYIKTGETENDNIRKMVTLVKAIGHLTNDYQTCSPIDLKCLDSAIKKISTYDGDNEYVNEIKSLMKQ